MGWEHTLDRWDPYLQELLALKADILATQFIVRALILRETLRKANFDPNQPRSPAGSPNGGQWTREGGGPSSGLPGSLPQEGSEAPAGESAPQRPRLHIEIWPSAGGPPLEAPPAIPETPPPGLRSQLRIARDVVRWLVRGVSMGHPVARLLGPLGLEAGFWLYDTYEPLISEYLAPPKTLAELQQDVQTPRPGTDVHHIVEEAAAKAAGFPASRINGPENLVRISRFRHELINREYARANRTFPPTLRRYLEDKSWDERREIGIQIMIETGTLKP
ncbi:hypothetical protein [Azorhizobium sp. AG788]|uniref:hypothetical protein n=1 Tax=Azorhizobium sp. AG788 TaxID=2183897 RepID=UPI003139B6E0